jgi:hypothetical protein
MKTRMFGYGCAVLFCAGFLFGEVTVRLETPDSSKLSFWQEPATVKIAVSNGTATSFNLYKNPFLARDSQFFWGVAPQSHMDNLIAGKAICQPHSFDWQYISLPRDRYSPLAPGEVRVWDFRGINVLPLSMFHYYSGIQLYVQVLVGPNTWAYSNTNSVRISLADIKSGLLRLDSAFLGTEGLVPFQMYEHELDGEHFLFSSRLERVCQIPDSAVPTFAVNTNTAVMTVSFGASAPPVNYNVKTGQIVP